MDKYDNFSISELESKLVKMDALLNQLKPRASFFATFFSFWASLIGFLTVFLILAITIFPEDYAIIAIEFVYEIESFAGVSIWVISIAVLVFVLATIILVRKHIDKTDREYEYLCNEMRKKQAPEREIITAKIQKLRRRLNLNQDYSKTIVTRPEVKRVCGDCRHFRILPPMGPGYPPYDCGLKTFHATWYNTPACKDFK